MFTTGSWQDRAYGALLGVHAGDALGATVEFSSHAEIVKRYPDGLREIIGGGPFDWPAGHATDDTDLTRAVLLAYLTPVTSGRNRAPETDVVRAAADHMLDWWRGDWPDREPGSRPRDIGGATEIGLRRYEAGGDPRAAGAGAGQAGNGSLMRCVPTGLMVHDRAERIRHSIEISAVTHDDPWCTVSCAAYNEIVHALLDAFTPAHAVDTGLAAAHELGQPEVADAIIFGRRLSLAGAAVTGQTFLRGEGRGLVLDSLSLAVAAVLDERSLVDVLVDVVRTGGDTDTNGAIAGGLLGARDGAAAIPEQWLVTLQFAAEFESAILALADASAE